MSYYDEVIRDAPDSIFMMDDNFLNASGRSVATQFTGAVDDTGPALVAGASKASLWNASASLQITFPLMKEGKEREPFTLESWFRPVAGAGQFSIATNSFTYDGLFWNGTSLTFSLKLSTGYVGVEYTPLVLSNMHIVGVYSGTALTLFVNGNPVASRQLTIAEQALKFSPVSTTQYIYHGTGVGLSNALAAYCLVLPADRIRAHYAAGIDTRPMDAAGTMHGGMFEKINLDQGETFLNRTFNDQITYENAIFTCSVTDVLAPKQDDDGTYLAGEWQTAVPLGQGGTSINGIKLSWVGTGIFSISTSIDGISWDQATKNDFKVSTIAPGFDGTGKWIYLKVNFAADFASEIKSISLVGYKDMGIKTLKRAITLPDDAVLFSDDQVITYSDANGLYTPTGLTIGATEEADPVYALGFWYNSPIGNVTVNVTPTAFYENSILRSPRTVNGRWTYAVYVFPATTTEIVITGNTNIVAPVLYSASIDAQQVKEIYYSYTGYPKLSLASSGVFSINTPTAKIYSNDWTSSGTG